MVDAFNGRDLDGTLACLGAEVRFDPLRLSGLAASYQDAGVRVWLVQLRRLRHEHRIVVSDARAVGEEQAIAVGSLSLAGEPDIGPFCGLHRLAGGLIVAAHHYLTEPDMIEYLGLVP